MSGRGTPSLNRLVRGGFMLSIILLTVNAWGAPDSSPTQSVDAVSKYVAAWNGTTEGLRDALAPEFLDTSSLLPGNGAFLAAQMNAWREAIPDLRVTILSRAHGQSEEILRLRYSGTPARPDELLPLTGGRIEIEQTEWLTTNAGKITGRRASPDDWTVPPELLFIPPPTQPFVSTPARVVTEFGPGQFLESIALSANGTAFVSTGPAGVIISVDASGKQRQFAKLDVGPQGFLMCLAFDSQGGLYATAISANPLIHGLWRFRADGTGGQIATLPPQAAPNGLALDEGHAQVLIADSFGGVVWSVPMQGGKAQVWTRDRLLAPRPLVGRFPGANGLQRVGEAIIVTVSDRSLVLRFPITASGAAGQPQIVAAALPADDFAAAQDGTLYVTTHPFNTVIRLTTLGKSTVIAGPRQNVIGPTSAALTPDGTALYIAADGGVYRPLPGVAPRARIVRLDLTQLK